MLDEENPAENPGATSSADSAETRIETGGNADSGQDFTGGPEAQAGVTQEVSAEPAAGAVDQGGSGEEGVAPAKKAAKKTTAKKATAKKATTKKAAAKRTTKKVAEAPAAEDGQPVGDGPGVAPDAGSHAAPDVTETEATGAVGAEAVQAAPAAKTAKRTTKKAAAKRTSKKAAAPQTQGAGASAPADAELESTEQPGAGETSEQAPGTPPPATALLFQAPDPTKAVVTRRRRATRPEAPAVAEPGPAAETAGTSAPDERQKSDKPEKKGGKGGKKSAKGRGEQPEKADAEEQAAQADAEEADETARGEEEQGAGERRRRRRGGRRRRRPGGGEENGSAEESEGEGGPDETPEPAAGSDEGEETPSTGSRRRRRRRRAGDSGDGNGDDDNTVTRVRKPRNAEDEITAVTGSTRLEAKKQRRREGREAGRRRAPIVSEAEFLARRESVDRVMVIRQHKDLTQIAVLEDKVLVEHYVSRESQTSLIGNVYLGRVQNVLPSMEAAFIDIGKGRNAVLYAGEVNWDALGAKNGSPRKIEQVLKSGQTVLVQVTKDPIGHKGARLTSQISLPGRFLVYVPDGTTSGISRKLPDTERNRLKNLLKDIVPDSAGVIVRTAAEGASEEELTRDVERLTARWADIEKKSAGGNAPQLLYGEPDLTLKVVRDLFTEDFKKLVISGDESWDMVQGYVSHVAPDLADRLERYDGERDVFAEYRIDEQIQKALDRKVWLPSGGSLVIDRTEAMTVVDVNTGKFTGSGGNLEETVTKNNLEAAEEIVRQLRLRDIGGIIVVDFIDMVLESNRDLVLRRLVECLGRDRTRHQVAEVTSLGLVQMTRKRIGTGLLEAFSESCEHCGGRGLVLHHEPVEPKRKTEEEPRRGRRGGRGRGREEAAASGNGAPGGAVPSPKDIAAMARHEETAGEEKRDEARPDGAPAGSAADQPAQPSDGKPAEPTAAKPGEPTDDKPVEPSDDKPAQPRRAGAGAPRDEDRQPTPHVPEDAKAAEQPDKADEAADRPGAGGPKGDEETAPESVPAESAAPVVPPAPTVVTTVRRRSARRPAGPAVSTSDAASGSQTSVAAPGEAVSPAEETAEDPGDGDVLATLVDAAEEVPSLDGSEESPSLDGADHEGAAQDTQGTPHVPVKRRGSRRR